jgi:hypothetical protein
VNQTAETRKPGASIAKIDTARRRRIKDARPPSAAPHAATDNKANTIGTSSD